jgi:pilus assembly protein Flp/PilA
MFQFSTLALRGSLRRFLHDERAATAIEYALIASGISIAIAGTVAILGGNVKNFYSSVAAALR